MNIYFNEYFNRIKLSLDSVDNSGLEAVVNLINNAVKNNKKIITVGNGGSASIASHITVDLINAANIKALSFSDSGIITCFSNDYGYENWVSKALDCYADAGDVAVLISSSGQSENMLIGAEKARSLGVDVITLTGFSTNNPLRKLGDINLWVDSDQYNIVEMTHHIWLLAVIDYIIENNKEK
ncbi:MAG: SIS domain-containing protein [Bacteriovoracaceae bacterium]|nr:SIS domain-containing protein [Bacteriovoracaceae bacterium]